MNIYPETGWSGAELVQIKNFIIFYHEELEKRGGLLGGCGGARETREQLVTIG